MTHPLDFDPERAKGAAGRFKKAMEEGCTMEPDYGVCDAERTGWEKTAGNCIIPIYQPKDPPHDPLLEECYGPWAQRKEYGRGGGHMWFERKLDRNKVAAFARGERTP